MRIGSGGMIRTIGDGPTLDRRIIVASYVGKAGLLASTLANLIAADEQRRNRLARLRRGFAMSKTYILTVRWPATGTYQKEEHDADGMVSFLAELADAVKLGTLVPGETFTLTIREDQS